MKSMRRCFSMFVAMMLVAVLLVDTSAGAASRKAVSFKSIQKQGKIYDFWDVKSVKISGTKIVISGEMVDEYEQAYSGKKFTFTLPKKVKTYEVEDKWYYIGKKSTSGIKKTCTASIKCKKENGYHFPGVYLIVKNKKVVGVATSA